MIVARKPCVIYDVDVIGVVGLLVLGLAGWFGVVVPANANAIEYAALSAQIAVAETKLEQASQRLREVNTRIASLQSGVAERTRDAPKRTALTSFLQCAATVAEECDLQIVQVVPQPVREAEGYFVGDVSFTGRGTCLDFARFVDRLARRNPYHAVQAFAIEQRGGEADDAQCQLSWTLRLYMLGDEAPAEAEGQP
jgi:Tfp pilus assembly protein PilO